MVTEQTELVSAGFVSRLSAFVVDIGLLAAVGKRLLGLRVVRATGGRVELRHAVIRLAGYVLSALPAYLGFAWVLFDRQHRGWHDLLAGTLVVYDRSAKASEPAAVRSRSSLSASGPMRVVRGGAVHTVS